MHERACWLDTVTPPEIPEVALPEKTDVAIVGGGSTGVAAARALAHRSIDTTILERETFGWGASTRNGGFVLPGFKREAGALLQRYGPERARALFDASLASVRFLEQVIAEEAIACDYRRSGHAILAWKPAHLRNLAATGEVLERQFGCHTTLVPRGQLVEEIDSTCYHGALIDPAAGSVQPAKYFFGLTAAALRAGARMLAGTEVHQIDRTAGGFSLVTSRGVLRAGEVVIATNGYPGGSHPGLRRRVVPIGSYIIATAPLAPDLAGSLIPRMRVLSDTKNHLYYFRCSADRRLVFGGRASFTPTTTAESARILQRGMLKVFPQLAGTRVEYSWSGTVGMTRDQLPHVGVMDGRHYAVGYCGHGVAMSGYLGHRIGEAIAGHDDLAPFSDLGFPAVPLYRGRPWFLPLVGAWYRVADWLM